MKRTIRLTNEYRLHDGTVEFLHDTTDWGDYSKNPEYTSEWRASSHYVVGTRAVLVSSTDVSPNAIRSGRDKPSYGLHFDLDGVPGNSNRDIKCTTGWRGTTDDRSCDAHGIVTIRQIRTLKNGDVAVTVS